MKLIPSAKHPAMLVREEYREHDELLVIESLPELANLHIRTVIDAGAAIGGFTRALLDLYPGAKVLCLEPNGQNLHVLARNVGAIPGVSVTRAALTYRHLQRVGSCGDDGRHVEFHRIKDPLHHGTGGHCIEPFHSPELFEGVDNVPALTVEEAIQSMGWPEVDLLKLDVEGEELDILTSFDRGRVRMIHLEWHLGRERTMEIVNRCLPGWSQTIVRDGEFGIMLLRKP